MTASPARRTLKVHLPSMNTATTNEIVVPKSVRRKAGIKAGEPLRFIPSAGTITIVAKHHADDEYTPVQRRVIDARLKKSLEEVKRGHTAGPFKTADEMIASLQRELKKPGQAKTKA